jgi:hypothetical protein
MLRADLFQQLHRDQLYLEHDTQPQPNQLIVPMVWLHGMFMQQKSGLGIPSAPETSLNNIWAF